MHYKFVKIVNNKKGKMIFNNNDLLLFSIFYSFFLILYQITYLYF